MKKDEFKIQDFSKSPKISEFGFREYDARWLYPEQINLSGIKKFGESLGILMSEEKIKPEIVVGHDYRSYSEEVKQSLISGLLTSGINVYDIGLTVSPGAYFAQFFLDCNQLQWLQPAIIKMVGLDLRWV